jgi:predicted transcriptional regulator of viral defense system
MPIKAYFIQRDVYELGKTAMLVDGIEMNVYDPERTVCDCFKYRSRLDSELFAKAVKAYAADENKDLSRLARYAKALGVYKIVKDTMEVLLNG